jgi:predicted dehydrogenase
VRLAFIGVGWIGRHRMEAILADRASEVVALADASEEALASAGALAPHAAVASTLDEVLALSPDGVVIATPSALHAEQAVQSLAAGAAVFCQKPLARNAQETARVVSAARKSGRLLGVDLSYRHTTAMRHIHELVSGGAIGDVYAVDLVFHNAYGPDKAWFRDPQLSGGGCVIDLGIHLVDLALWTLGYPEVVAVTSRLYAGGSPVRAREDAVEDYAIAQIDLARGISVRLACSWNLAAGRDAVIEASFHGTRAGVSLRNVNGSFYDFVAERYDGTRTTVLAEPPDAWGGRAAVTWARRLAAGGAYDGEIERMNDVAKVLDAIYGR